MVLENVRSVRKGEKYVWVAKVRFESGKVKRIVMHCIVKMMVVVMMMINRCE